MQTPPAWPPIDIERATPAGPVLVVGGAGYIGSHTVRLLERRKVPVVVLDNLSTGHREAVRSPLEICELSDRAAIARVLAKHKPVAVVPVYELVPAMVSAGESSADQVIVPGVSRGSTVRSTLIPGGYPPVFPEELTPGVT